MRSVGLSLAILLMIFIQPGVGERHPCGVEYRWDTRTIPALTVIPIGLLDGENYECLSLLFVFWNCVILNWRDSGMHAEHGFKSR